MTTVQGTAVKPVDIKGKLYVTVADRVNAAHEAEDVNLGYSIVEERAFELNGRYFFMVKIMVADHEFMGTSEIKFNAKAGTPDALSPIECAETSAIGRALGFAGFGLIDSIATDDEIARAKNEQERPTTKPAPQRNTSTAEATAIQRGRAIGLTAEQLRRTHTAYMDKQRHTNVTPEDGWQTIAENMLHAEYASRTFAAVNGVGKKLDKYLKDQDHEVTFEEFFNDLHDEMKRGEILGSMKDMAA